MIDVLYASLTGYPTPHEGGGNRIIYDLIKNLPADQFSRGYVSYTFQKKYGTVQIMPDPMDDLPAKKKIGSYLFQKVPFYKKLVSSPFYHERYYERMNRYFSSFAQKANCNIVHAHHPLVLPCFAECKGKKILSVHAKGGFAHESKIRGFNKHFYAEHFRRLEEQEHNALRIADSVTFPSIAAKELFFRVNDIECPEEKIKIIYNGVDLEFIDGILPDKNIFHRYKIRGDAELYIFNVAEHTVQKNIPLLIKTINVIVKELEKDVIMINVGSGEGTSEFVTMVNGLELRNNIFFLGSMSNQEVIKFMKVCDCFVLTSTDVIFDLVVLEALACGTAVIVSNEGGNKEIITNGDNGYLIAQNNEKIIAKLIANADYDRVKYGSAKLISKYSMKKMIENYELLYRDVVA